MLCKYTLRNPLQPGIIHLVLIQSGSRHGTLTLLTLFLPCSDSRAEINLVHYFYLVYTINAVCIYFLPIIVSVQQEWSDYISTTGWKWVSACLIKSIMLQQTLFLQKQLREAWNRSGKSKSFRLRFVLSPGPSIMLQMIVLEQLGGWKDAEWWVAGAWPETGLPESYAEVLCCCCIRGGAKPQLSCYHKVVWLT